MKQDLIRFYKGVVATDDILWWNFYIFKPENLHFLFLL